VVQDALNSSNQQKKDISKRILDANADIAERVQADGLEIDYSSEDDFLRVTVGEPRPSLSAGLRDDLRSIVLYDPDTFEITAVEVPFFMERVSHASSVPEIWRLISELVKKRSSAATVFVPAARETKHTIEAFRDLVLANGG
jgi:hypothetical protein